MTEEATASSSTNGRDPSLALPIADQAGWTSTDVRTVDTIEVRESPVTTTASYVVEAGSSTLHAA